jgi:hypothetical protein
VEMTCRVVQDVNRYREEEDFGAGGVDSAGFGDEDGGFHLSLPVPMGLRTIMNGILCRLVPAFQTTNHTVEPSQAGCGVVK